MAARKKTARKAGKSRPSARKGGAKKAAKRSARKPQAKRPARKSAKKSSARMPAKKTAPRKSPTRKSPIQRVASVAKQVAQQAQAAVTGGVDALREIRENIAERVGGQGEPSGQSGQTPAS